MEKITKHDIVTTILMFGILASTFVLIRYANDIKTLLELL